MSGTMRNHSAQGAHETDEQIMARRARLLGPAYRLFYERPVHLVRGKGIWLYDAQGRQYLDMYNNVACVGHAHPHVVKALHEQALTLNTHTRYLHSGILDYAEKLLGYFPPELSQVMFACTGSEANDLALRIAHLHSGGKGLIITETAYHGTTVTLAQASPSLGAAVTLGDFVRTVPPPDTYRGDPDQARARFAADVRGAIASLEAANIKPAALLIDGIFSSDGVFAHPIGVINDAVDEIRRAGGLYIADEVQPGFGRTGDGMWGFSRHGVVPDLVTLGKPMGNGHPVAGVVARPELLTEFGARSRYFNTFGGNPVSAAVGNAVLEVIEDEALIANARSRGLELRAGLEELAKRCELIGDIRGAGLFIGLELVKDRKTREPASAETAKLVNVLREKQILIGAAGPRGNCLKIRPPLCFSKENGEMFLARFEEALSEVAATSA